MEENNNIVDIQPVSKGKRTLVFLGDFFICFILTFVLMMLAVQPLASLITKLDDKEKTALEAEKNRDDILYDSKLLFFLNNDEKYNYEKNLAFTFQRFVSYYAFSEEHPSDVNQEYYGHQKESEIFSSYYIDYKSDSATYNTIFNNSDYFVIEDSEKTLKETYKEQFVNLYLPGDELSEAANIQYQRLYEEFLGAYANMVNDIKKNDLKIDDRSFIYYQNIMDDFAKYSDWLYVISSLIAFFIAWFICFVGMPLIFDNGQTITMKVMKIERIGMNNLYTVNKGESILIGVYQFVLCLVGVSFIPLAYVPFYYLFNLPLLIPLSSISLLLLLSSTMIMLLNKYSRTGSDLLSRTVLISEADLNKIYEARGYQI